MTLISRQYLDPVKAPEISPKEVKGSLFTKFLAYINLLDQQPYSPDEKKSLGYNRCVTKESFRTLRPDQQQIILQKLGFNEAEIQKIRKSWAKERLKGIVRAYKKYSTKTTHDGAPLYTEKQVHQMLKKLHYADREINIARTYYLAQREQEVGKSYEKYVDKEKLVPLRPLPRSKPVESFVEPKTVVEQGFFHRLMLVGMILLTLILDILVLLVTSLFFFDVIQ